MLSGRGNRLRATSAIAAAPNRIIIGGAGTGEGFPLEPLLDDDPLDELELEELDELELDEDPPMPPVLLVLEEPLELNPPVEDE